MLEVVQLNTSLSTQIGNPGRSALWATLLCLSFLATGCSRFRPKPEVQWVYVSAKQTYLRDRVAAVSNRTATVTNGDKLQVLDHGRRFLKVQTPKGEQGWIDEKAVATQQVYDQFTSLRDAHKNDPIAASAVVRDEVYLHARPGRDSDRFFLLNEGLKLKMLERATLPKPVPPGMKAAKPPVPTPGKPATAEPAPPPPAMEDWWLVRDNDGRTGWIYSRMIDVDAPDALTRYAEGQRIVGAYVLTTVHDDEAEGDNKDVPIYVTVMSPYKAGLPYDFDQVRVFTWNVKKHRYETAFRDRNIEGYLPVTIKSEKDPYGKSASPATPAPTFTYKVLAAEAPEVIPDPETGAVVPSKTVQKTYRLEGNIVRRILQPGTPATLEARPAEEKKSPAAAKAKRKR
jgi:SH3-like domain-containing protein